MKHFLVFVLSVIIGSLFLCCSPPTAPSFEASVLEYSVEASESVGSADIVYRNELNELITLSDQSLPWSVSIVLGEQFSGDVYLNVTAPESVVFNHFASGNADADLINKLVDSSADFTSAGVLVGDKIYSDPSLASAANITEIVDANTLQLDNDLFEFGTEPYYIYHSKNLSIEVLLNGEAVDAASAEGFRILSALVQTTIDM